MTEETNAGQRRGWWTWLVLIGVLVIAAILSYLHHLRSRAFTADDIAIFGAALSLAATVMAVLAAQASGNAARDSLNALRLNYRPGDIRIGFTTRDPRNQEVQKSDPAPANALWMSVAFWSGWQPEYTAEWSDDAGQRHHHLLYPEGRPLAQTEVTPILLRGVSARQGNTAEDITARVHGLRFLCRDAQSGGRWVATYTAPSDDRPTSALLFFRPEE